MKKLAAFAALAIAALVAVVLGATATGASPGPAGVQRVPWGGASSTEACLVTHSNGSKGACLVIGAAGMMTTDGTSVFGNGTATIDRSVQDSSQIVRVQLDRITLGNQHQGVTLATSPYPAANSGSHPLPISADTNHIAWTTDCTSRYHVRVYYSVRMSDGRILKGSALGPWFDSGHATCGGNGYGQPASALPCLVTHSDGTHGVCLSANVRAVISHDSGRIYARGAVGVRTGTPDANLVKRVQIDQAVIKVVPNKVVASTVEFANSGATLPPYIEAETTTGYPWVLDSTGNQNCSVQYQAVMRYSVRYNPHSQLFQGRLVTPNFTAPNC